MFTGIVEELGEVIGVEELERAARLLVRGAKVAAEAAPGDSIAVNGVCLTVTGLADGVFSADVMYETLLRSDLGELTVGSPVNLERPVAFGGRLGGHLVQGHVDGICEILDRIPAEHWQVLRLALPVDLARYVVEKGSVAVDGVSLTVVRTGAEPEAWFSVGLIPATLQATTLGRKQVGDHVNLEVDVVAKYVERMVDSQVGEGRP